jgi:hypothetical protein
MVGSGWFPLGSLCELCHLCGQLFVEAVVVASVADDLGDSGLGHLELVGDLLQAPAVGDELSQGVSSDRGPCVGPFLVLGDALASCFG